MLERLFLVLCVRLLLPGLLGWSGLRDLAPLPALPQLSVADRLLLRLRLALLRECVPRMRVRSGNRYPPQFPKTWSSCPISGTKLRLTTPGSWIRRR